MSASAPDRLRELSPSAKLVYRVLEDEGRLSLKGIADESLLPPRTVRDALSSLDDAELLAERTSLEDSRQTLYWLDD